MRPALLLYRGLTWLAVLLGVPYLFYRHRRYPEEMAERWGGGTGLRGPEDVPVPEGAVWVHAASLGEVEAVRAWMEEAPLRDGVAWFVTVTSTSARRRAGERLGPGVSVGFAPIDHEIAVGRFLRRYRPRALVLVETELWPLTLDRCRRAGIPVYVASGRISGPAWTRVRRVARLYREIASAVRGAAVQGPEDEERYRALSISPVRVCGNLKYRVPEPAQAGSEEPVEGGAETIPTETGPPIWVIGSLRQGEEAVLGAALEVAGAGGWVVLAPRHLREMEGWATACRDRGLEPVLRSQTPERALSERAVLAEVLKSVSGDVGPRILLVDLHGELRAWYGRARAATVGGTWVPVGGHNLFEPLSEGVPVSFGPYVANVRDVRDAALAEGAGFEAPDPAELAQWVLSTFDPVTRQKMERSALRTARQLAGAGERTRTFLSGTEATEAGGGIFRP